MLSGRVQVAGLQGGGSRTSHRYSCLWSEAVPGHETAPDTMYCWSLQSRAAAAAVVVLYVFNVVVGKQQLNIVHSHISTLFLSLTSINPYDLVFSKTLC